jgi:hypothetical protein
MTELHIFDFDGTLFYSPAPTRSAVAATLFPHPAAVTTPVTAVNVSDDDGGAAAGVQNAEELRDAEANKLYGSLLNPVDSGGYGWFQSLHTMSPPFVPETPDPEVWFVAPILAHMRALVERRNTLLQDPHARAEDMPLLYVVTGRDVKYYDRIWTLLEQVGLDREVEDVVLKPHETAGTVTYKLNNFFKLIQYHCPSRVFYYEDRVEQGGRLLEGIRVLEEVLYCRKCGNSGSGGTSSGSGTSTTVADRVGVVTFDVKTTQEESTTTVNSDGTIVHDSARRTPQPGVLFRFGARGGDCQPSPAEAADPRHAVLTSTLRASPYQLLRDACYPLHRLAAFYEDEADITGEKARKAAEHAERQAQRWVEGTIEFWNAKNTSGRGRCGRGGGRGRGGGPAAKRRTTTASSSGGFDTRVLHDAIQFPVAPPFTFIMVLVPAAISERSNYMLDTAQFAALVEQLKFAREKSVQMPTVSGER